MTHGLVSRVVWLWPFLLTQKTELQSGYMAVQVIPGTAGKFFGFCTTGQGWVMSYFPFSSVYSVCGPLLRIEDGWYTGRRKASRMGEQELENPYFITYSTMLLEHKHP